MEQKRTPKRASINGTRNRLNVKNQDPAYVYRIVNDIDDRVQRLLDLGYEVDTETAVGDKRAGAASKAPGTPITVSLGRGDKGVVMKIRRELFEERQAEKRAGIAETEDVLRNPASNGADYGRVEINSRRER